MKRSGRLTQTSRFVLAAAVVVVFGTTQAQEVAPMPPPPPSGPDFLYRAGGPGGPDDPVIFIRFEAELGGKTVTGAPFAATTYSSPPGDFHTCESASSFGESGYSHTSCQS